MEARSKQFCNRCNAEGLEQNVCFALPPFSLIGRVINKVLQKNAEAMILVTPTWQTQPWHALLLRMSIQLPLHLPALQNLLVNPLGEKHPLVKTRSLRSGWKITEKAWKSKEFQVLKPNLSPCLGDQFQLQVTNGLAGAVDNKFIQFVRH